MRYQPGIPEGSNTKVPCSNRDLLSSFHALCMQGIVGFGIGLASMGHTAIAEIQFGKLHSATIAFPLSHYHYSTWARAASGADSTPAPCVLASGLHLPGI